MTALLTFAAGMIIGFILSLTLGTILMAAETDPDR